MHLSDEMPYISKYIYLQIRYIFLINKIVNYQIRLSGKKQYLYF